MLGEEFTLSPSSLCRGGFEHRNDDGHLAVPGTVNAIASPAHRAGGFAQTPSLGGLHLEKLIQLARLRVEHVDQDDGPIVILDWDDIGGTQRCGHSSSFWSQFGVWIVLGHMERPHAATAV
jgi:hypothetical protein